MGRSVLYTRGNGATVRAKVVKNAENGAYDIQFQHDGNDVVRLSVRSSSYFSFTARYSAAVFLLSNPADFSVAYFQYSMHYYRDEMTRQHFTCHVHYYRQVWNWFLEKLADLNHAC